MLRAGDRAGQTPGDSADAEAGGRESCRPQEVAARRRPLLRVWARISARVCARIGLGRPRYYGCWLGLT
jgi:hypothetical protein